jgi:hypothetical protein
MTIPELQHHYPDWRFVQKLLSIAIIAVLLLALAACGKPYTPAPNPPVVLGEKYLTELDYEQALLQFDQAIVVDPKNPRGYLGKADALLHLDRQPEAVAALADGAKAVPKEQREPLQAAQAEVEKSPVDGYIGLSSAYEKLGWREIALVLLKRVCEELPEESRLREALEGLIISTPENRVSGDQQNSESNATLIELPENVFGMKDVLEFGITLDSDIYAIADKLNIPHNRVFSESGSAPENEYEPYIIQNNSGVWQICYAYSNNEYRGWTSPSSFTTENGRISFDIGQGSEYAANLLAKFQLIRGIGIGTPAEDVLQLFYYSDESAAIFDSSGLSGFEAHSFRASNFGDTLIYVLYYLPTPHDVAYGYWRKYSSSETELGYMLNDNERNIAYAVDFIIKNGTVDSMSWTAIRGGYAISLPEEARP